MALAPKQPTGPWYTEAIAAVQKYRDDLWAAEQQEWTHRRKPIVEKLENEINRLEEKQRTAVRKHSGADYWEFAAWVWKEWPPKTEGVHRFYLESLIPPSSADKAQVRRMYPVSSSLLKNELSRSCR